MTPQARSQIQEISRWWRANRPKNPGLFREELVGIRQLLARMPAAGPVYDSPDHRDVHRMLLPRTQHHVYYVIDQQQRIVTVLAVWHTARGSEPLL